jgi:hypothetical protein
LVEQSNTTAYGSDTWILSIPAEPASLSATPLRGWRHGDTCVAPKETGGLVGSQAPSAPVQLDGSSDWSDQHRLGKLRGRFNSFVAIGADQRWPRDGRDNIDSHRLLLHPTTRDNRL